MFNVQFPKRCSFNIPNPLGGKPLGMNLLLSLMTSLALAGGSTVFAQEVNPLQNDPRAARVGGSLFRAQCATCHGGDAKGISSIDAPDLTTMWVGGEKSDLDAFTIIKDGIPGSIMPAHGFTDPEIWMLVSFLHSVAVTGTQEAIPGNPLQGAQLFAANCVRCHRIAGEGGSLGPDLSGILSRRSQQAMHISIREPSASIGRRYKPVTLTTASREQVRGTLKSEDAFSIQIMDEQQRLRAFMKQDLTTLVREDSSLMPQFTAAQLSDSAIDDILRFLQSQL